MSTVALILVAVVGLAAWSKLRHTDKPVYEQPQRWKVEDHPLLGAGMRYEP
jgi:hypothetical protein